jgi:predicted AAA+ superfamily ATPase
MYISRHINLLKLLEKSSLFLLGARQTGKSSLIKAQLAAHPLIDLLEPEVYITLQQNPARLLEYCSPNSRFVVVDEVQRIPELLNVVHSVIESRKINFLLTGSSARKLRKAGVNLLGGRAARVHLFPFTSQELGTHFEIMRALEWGTLPSIYLSNDPAYLLHSYTELYLKEELIQEAAVRQLPAFTRFLQQAALRHGTQINYSNIANDSQVAVSTVRDYYQLLEDTLIGTQLLSWKSGKRKAISASKFYFFDTGVARTLQKAAPLVRDSDAFGQAFESFIFTEIRAFLEYSGKITTKELFYWRSSTGLEVDFILGDVLIEVKATSNVVPRMLKGLKALSEELSWRRKIVICFESQARYLGEGIEVIPIAEFLRQLWAGEVV